MNACPSLPSLWTASENTNPGFMILLRLVLLSGGGEQGHDEHFELSPKCASVHPLLLLKGVKNRACRKNLTLVSSQGS